MVPGDVEGSIMRKAKRGAGSELHNRARWALAGMFGCHEPVTFVQVLDLQRFSPAH
jgi:hypothetical protein